MPRKPKTEQPLSRKSSASPPALFAHLYGMRDPATDNLLTALLYAGETLASPEEPHQRALPLSHARSASAADALDDFGWLREITDLLRVRLAEDPRRAGLLAQLPTAFGDGNSLALLFRNLFPSQPMRKQLDANGKFILSQRETEVLALATGDHTHAKIAEMLGIEVDTVHRHFKNIYRKLGVQRRFQAIAHAIALGYLKWDAYTFTLIAAQGHLPGVDTFQSFCASVGSDIPIREDTRALISLGLLLLAVSGIAARQRHGDANLHPPRGLICELNEQGEILHAFGSDHIEVARSIAVAPPHAVKQGFTPGNLFVAHDLHPQDGLCRAAISEFTPERKYLRTFSGGAEVGTRLVGPLSIAFAADGRLLATSGWLTEAILAFEVCGAFVRRFTNGHFMQIAVGQDGRIYATQHHALINDIRSFDSCGQLQETFGANQGTPYHGLAINSHGHVFVTHEERDRRIVEEYDADGKHLHSFTPPGRSSGHLAIDIQDRLYLPCPLDAEIKVLSGKGEMLRRWNVARSILPRAVAVGPDEHIWVCGKQPSGDG